MKLHKLAAAISVVVSGAVSLEASALEMGGVKLHSALSQPLSAQIELLDMGAFAPQDIMVNVGSPMDFDRAGIERPAVLDQLKFTPTTGASGKPVVMISTIQPIDEPYLNFLVEMNWPSGRLLKEYTLLLDAPITSAESAIPVNLPLIKVDVPTGQPVLMPQEPTVTPNELSTWTDADLLAMPLPEVETTPIPEEALPPMPGLEPEVVFTPIPQPQQTDTITVQKGDTLWRISKMVRPQGVSVQQMMLAIQAANPEAFARGNINNMNSGQVLRIPQTSDVPMLAVRQAQVEVARQNEEWFGGSQQAQIDATNRPVNMHTDTKPHADGHLAIVDAGASNKRGQDLGGTQQKVVDQLNTELAMSREQVDQLASENNELQGRLTDLEAQVETLVRLIALKDDQLAALQNQAVTEEAVAEEAVAQEAVAQEAKNAKLSEQIAIIGNWMKENLMLLLLALLPLGFISWLLAWRRSNEKKRQREEAANDNAEEVEADSAAAWNFDESLTIDDSEPEEQPANPHISDPLAEADVFIAYGRLDQAEALLQKAIAEHPKRIDLQLKLMELYSQTGNQAGFEQMYEALVPAATQEEVNAANRMRSRFNVAAAAAQTPATVPNAPQAPQMPTDTTPSTGPGALRFNQPLNVQPQQVPAPPSATVQPSAPAPEPEPAAPEANDDDIFNFDDNDQFEDDTMPFDDFDDEDIGRSLLDDFDFVLEDDEVATKLDLARAYLEMGDTEGTKTILLEVMEQGTDSQKAQAQRMLDQMG